MRKEEFVALVVRMRSCLKIKFTAKDINALKSEHRKFSRGIRGEVVIKIIIDSQTDMMLFDEGWCGGLNEHFPLICGISGGLTPTYAGTARVKSNLSILGVEKNAYRTSLMNLSFDGIIHAKRIMELQALATCLSYTS